MGAIGADCFKVFSETERNVNKDSWDLERFGMVCTKSENFAEWKGALTQLCAQTKNCDEETVNAIFRKIQKIP